MDLHAQQFSFLLPVQQNNFGKNNMFVAYEVFAKVTNRLSDWMKDLVMLNGDY